MENESRLLKSNPVSVPQNNINRQSTPVFIECGSNSKYILQNINFILFLALNNMYHKNVIK